MADAAGRGGTGLSGSAADTRFRPGGGPGAAQRLFTPPGRSMYQDGAVFLKLEGRLVSIDDCDFTGVELPPEV